VATVTETLEGWLGGGLLAIVVLFGGLALLASGVQDNERTKMSDACSGTKHDMCDGHATNSSAKQAKPCPRTCHVAPMTSWCGDQDRHDVCECLVEMPSGSIQDCGCTCHARGAPTSRHSAPYQRTWQPADRACLTRSLFPSRSTSHFTFVPKFSHQRRTDWTHKRVE
jgi:hypothetical protein